MKINDLNQPEDKLDIISFYYILLKNIKTFILFILIFLILGIIFYYNLPPRFFEKNRNDAVINILVDENPLLSNKKIIEKLNLNLASAYNYEIWCAKTNKDCYLDQHYASRIQVVLKVHWVSLKFSTKKHLEEIISFLSFTIQRVNSKILKETKSMYQDKINILEDKIAVQTMELRKIEKETFDTQVRKKATATDKEKEMQAIFQSELDYIEDEIVSRTDNIKIAEEELLNLENLLELTEEGNKLILSLKIIEVMNSIKKDKFQINNLKRSFEKKENAFEGKVDTIEQLESMLLLELEEFEPVYTSDEQNIELFLKMYPNVEMRIIQLKQSIYRLEKDLDELLDEKRHETKNVLKLGRINSTFKEISVLKDLIPILLAFIIISIILCSIFLLLKEEYIKRKIK